jgi:nucleoside-diphosphate-sugar epimerase
MYIYNVGTRTTTSVDRIAEIVAEELGSGTAGGTRAGGRDGVIGT